MVNRSAVARCPASASEVNGGGIPVDAADTTGSARIMRPQVDPRQRRKLADRVEIEGPLWLLESDDRFEPLWSAFRTALIAIAATRATELKVR